jgi:histidinol dehydrogenase
MTPELDQLLFTYRDPQWLDKLQQIQKAAQDATYFEDGSQQDKQLTHIIKTVKQNKNQALIDFTAKFDNVSLTEDQLQVSSAELKNAHTNINKDLLKSLRQAIENVRIYQSDIFTANKNTHPGIRYTPLERIGVCIPGASAPLPSTVIMTAVPAMIAGVKQIVLISPPRYKNSIHPVILALCYELGIEEVYRIGGSHAVAALAYGTETIKQVHKIVGPGNQWVQMAKRKVYGRVDIDSIAGPSEVLIIANDQANPAWVAADMLSQAEHAPGSALVFTDSQRLANDILEQLKKQVTLLGRSQETSACLCKFSGIICFENMKDVIDQANIMASEHLEIQCGDRTDHISQQINNAGAMFLGSFTPVAVGDYWAGPSHTLPTGRSARFFSALSSNDFVKATSIIQYDQDMLNCCAADIIKLAMTEGLDAHANSIRIRMK